MNPDDVALVLMDAVEAHETEGCWPSLLRLTALRTDDALVEAGCILTDRVCAHVAAEPGERKHFTVSSLPQTRPRRDDLMHLLAATLAEGIAEGRDAVGPLWAGVDAELKSMAVATLFHVSIELGAWTRASDLS